MHGNRICYYFINDATAPSFVVDVSANYEAKRAALDCYKSQFQRSSPRRPDAHQHAALSTTIESRDAGGALAGVRWAEAWWFANRFCAPAC
jgi:LmbE family N-acetylglucosaminyl deacetylase